MITPTAIQDDVADVSTDVHDEATLPDGSPRVLYRELLPALEASDPATLAARVRAWVDERGVAFRSGGELRPFAVDPVPRLIARSEWEWLAWGITQRVRALHAFVADVYGERRIVRAGRVPERVIETADHFEPWLMGVKQPSVPVGVAGLDIVRGSDGRLAVLEDNLRTPSGLSYTAAAREAVDAALPLDPPSERRPADAAAELLLKALRAAAPDGSGDPSIALLSDGPDNSAWYEHGELARGMGIPLVLRRDLHMRRGRLHARAPDGRVRPLDVIYLRADEDRLRDERGRATWLADALLDPVRRGTLAVVNPLGGGVADDKLAHAYVPAMIRFYLGEEPRLRSVSTYDLADHGQRRAALDRLDDLVVKPRSGHGGAGIVVCRHATREDRERVARAIERDPGDYVAQETVLLSTHPTVYEDGLEPRHIDLRAFAIGSQVMPGGLTRFARDRGALVVNSSQGGGAKDTWVVG